MTSSREAPRRTAPLLDLESELQREMGGALDPEMLQTVEIQRDLRRLKVHTRCLRSQGGAWEGWAVWPWPGEERGAKRSFYELELP